jgi:Fe-S-cluster containining protein
MSEPPSEAELTNQIIHYTCLKNCYGKKGNAGACCTIQDRDWIIGPITDANEFLERLKKHFGKNFRFDEVFIQYNEGKKLFPEKTTWQNPKHYPALRVLIDQEGIHPCPFLGSSKECTIQSIKPAICSAYLCDHLKTVISSVTGNPKK